MQPLLQALIGDDSPERRHAYDAAFVDFRDACLTFVGLARETLEVRDEAG
ncbi:hypothetical protein ACGF5F_34445 [Streptomyces sp. NPDC047821]